jgi:hypothetical protein
MQGILPNVILRCEPSGAIAPLTWASLEGWMLEKGACCTSFEARKSALLRMTSSFFETEKRQRQ